LSQGAISQHLDGKISNLNGMTFEYTVAAQ
jgi:hypothetical protein